MEQKDYIELLAVHCTFSFHVDDFVVELVLKRRSCVYSNMLLKQIVMVLNSCSAFLD